MKKLVCLVLALLTVTGLVACGGNGSSDTGTGAGEVTTNAAGETSAPETDPDKRIGFLPDETYDGYEFRVLMTNLNSDSVIVRDFADVTDYSSDVLNEGLYRRNTRVESELDIKLVGEEDYKSSNTGRVKVQKANLANDTVYDMCVMATYDAGKLAISGDLAKLNDFGYIDLSHEWWDQNVNRELAVGGNIYFTAGDISLVMTQAMYNVLFNKEMFKARGWEYPYETVKAGKWTLDKMTEYVMQVTDDLDGNNIMDSNDLYGFCYINSTVIAFLGTAGAKIAKVNDDGLLELTIAEERASSAVTSFVELTKNYNYAYNGQRGTGGVSAVDMFGQNHCLFRAIEHIGFPHFRDTELEYGILPLPKLDEAQERYYTPFGGWDAAFVCVPAMVSDVEQTSAIIEYIAYASREEVTPRYYEKTLVGKYIRDDDSYDMITLEIENRVYDAGYVYGIGGLTSAVEQLSAIYSTNYASMVEAYRRQSKKDIDTANKALAPEAVAADTAN